MRENLAAEGKYGDFGKIKTEWDRIGKELPAKKEQLEEATNAYSRLLSKYSVDEKTLKEFEQVRESLVSLGLDLKDLEKTEKFLAEVKKNGYDSKKVVTKRSSIDDLESENTKLGNRNPKEWRVSDGPAGQHKNAKGDLSKKSDSLEEARRLTENGIEIARFRSEESCSYHRIKSRRDSKRSMAAFC